MIRRASIPVAAVLLLAACGGSDGDDAATAATVDPAPATSAAAATATGSGALQFTAPLVGGGQIDLSELGERPVLLWFWAPW